MSFRSEHSANLSLIPTTKRPSWMDPAPVRTYRKTNWLLICLPLWLQYLLK